MKAPNSHPFVPGIRIIPPIIDQPLADGIIHDIIGHSLNILFFSQGVIKKSFLPAGFV